MAKKRRVMSKAQKLAHYKSLMAQMRAQGIASPIERARYVKYANAVKKLGGAAHNPEQNPRHKKRKHNPMGFGGVSLGRDAHGRFVKSNPKGAHEWGYAVGKYAKKGKKKVHAAYHGTKKFLGAMHKGWYENPYGGGPVPMPLNPSYEHNPYAHRNVGTFPMPLMNPKHKKRHKSSKAHRGHMLARSLRRDAHGRFLPRGY